jgi:hypothetical protein
VKKRVDDSFGGWGRGTAKGSVESEGDEEEDVFMI